MAKDIVWPRPTRDQWGALRIQLWLFFVLQIVTTGLSSIELFAGIIDFDAEPDLIVAAFGLATIASVVLFFIVFLLCIVGTCRITYRMARNLHELEAPGALPTPGWAVGWYFIPIANLFIPYQDLKKIWRATFELAGQPEPDDLRRILWWLCWIVGNISGNISLRMSIESGGMSGYPHDPNLYIWSLHVGIFSGIVSALGSLFMMSVFGPLSRAQDEIINARNAAPAGSPG